MFLLRGKVGRRSPSLVAEQSRRGLWPSHDTLVAEISRGGTRTLFMWEQHAELSISGTTVL